MARTDPKDVARVESKTVICTEKQRDAVPDTDSNAPSKLGHWIAPNDLTKAVNSRFPGCMKGEINFFINKKMFSAYLSNL